MASCEPCQPGQFAGIASSSCEFCSSGRADGDSDPATECVDCNAGTYAGCGETDCTECEAGEVDSDGSAATPCTACLAGQYWEAASATNISRCVQCPVGKADRDSDSTTVCEDCVVGEYCGELLTLTDYRARYGTTEGSAWRPPDDNEWHAQWSAQRRSRGVGCTGQYVLKLTSDVYLDAEDPLHANWTRFINHSDSPNLVVERGARSAHFIVQQNAAPGDELTFSYSRGYARWIERYCQ